MAEVETLPDLPVNKSELYSDVCKRQMLFDMDVDIVRDIHIAMGKDDTEWRAYLEQLKTCDRPFQGFSDLKDMHGITRFPAAVYTSAVVGLLVSICSDGAALHGVLADAMQDAGLVDLEIIDHLLLPHHRPDCVVISWLLCDLPG